MIVLLTSCDRLEQFKSEKYKTNVSCEETFGDIQRNA